MAFAAACVLLLICWVLFLAGAIPLPLNSAFFGWVRRQWLVEGAAVLASLAALRISLPALGRGKGAAFPSWWLPFWCWLGWATFSILYSIDRDASLRSLMAYASFGLLAYTISVLARQSRNFMVWSRCLAFVAVVVSVEGLFQYFRTFQPTLALFEQLQLQGDVAIRGWGEGVLKDFLIRKRIFSLFGWPNLFAGFLLLTIPLLFAFVRISRGSARFFWLLAAAVLSLCLILTLSMGAWIAAIFTACLVFWLRGALKKRLPVNPLLLAAVATTLVCVTSYMVARRSRNMIRDSTSSRVVYVLGALNVVRHAPLLGTGFGTFGTSYRALMPLEKQEAEHGAIHAHNTLMQVAAELGLIGLGFFMWFLIRVWRLVRMAVAPSPGGREAIVRRGLAVGLAAFFIHSILEQTFVEVGVAPFWWIGLGLLTARNGKGGSVLRSGLPAAAVAVLLLAAGWWAYTDGLATRGMLLAGQGDVPHAVRHLDVATAKNPLAWRYAMEAGVAVLHAPGQQKALKAAENRFALVTTRSPWLGQGWLQLGLVKAQLGQTDAAIAALKQAAGRDPNSRRAHHELVKMLLQQHRAEEALPVIRHLQRIEPQPPDAWFTEALAYQQLQQTDKAIGCYQVVLQRHPQHYMSWFNLAKLLRQSAMGEESRAAFSRFLETAPAADAAARSEALQALAEPLP